MTPQQLRAQRYLNISAMFFGVFLTMIDRTLGTIVFMTAMSWMLIREFFWRKP